MSSKRSERVDDPFHTGEKLRRLRLRDEFTLEDAADRVGVGKSTLSDYENRWLLPPREVLAKAAALYKVDLSLFYNTEHLTVNVTNHGQKGGQGYVQEQHLIDSGIHERYMAHIAERSKKLEALTERALESQSETLELIKQLLKGRSKI